MLTGGIFRMFFLFYNFLKIFVFSTCWQQRFLHLVTHGIQKKCFLSVFFFILLCLKFYFLLLFLWDSYSSCMLLSISQNTFFSLGLICNKWKCLSMIYLMFCIVLLNFSTSGILDLFSIFVVKLITHIYNHVFDSTYVTILHSVTNDILVSLNFHIYFDNPVLFLYLGVNLW